jgi:hypothetical protein
MDDSPFPRSTQLEAEEHASVDRQHGATEHVIPGEAITERMREREHPLADGRPWCQVPYHEASPSCSTIASVGGGLHADAVRDEIRTALLVLGVARPGGDAGPMTRAWRRATRSSGRAL